MLMKVQNKNLMCEQEIIEYLTQDIRDISLKSEIENEKIGQEFIKMLPLCKYRYSKTNYKKLFLKNDIEKCPGAIESYHRYSVFENNLNEKLEYKGFQLTADVMTSALWLIEEFLCSNIGMQIKNNIDSSCSLEGNNVLEKDDKKTFIAMNAFLRCVYTIGNFTPAGKNRGSGGKGCRDQWDCAMEDFLKYKNEKLTNEDVDFLKNSTLNNRTNKIGYQLLEYVFEDAINVLYFQDYIFSKDNVKEIKKKNDNGEYDWYVIFSTYTKLILQRGYRIVTDKIDDVWERDEKDILNKLFEKVGLPLDDCDPI